MDVSSKTVLILGAGINGCAIARELAINGINVWIVDAADIASGATSGSSRLIHGGLRYLEYGEFDLVKESLAERTRLLRLAPQFVRPLRLWIPAEGRLGGLIPAVGRFFGWSWWPQPKSPRGSLLISAGLMFYDAYAHDATLPKHTCGPVNAADAPRVDQRQYHQLCSYYDGQVEFPERLVCSMLADAKQLSTQQGLDFRLFNYHRAKLVEDTVEITPVETAPQSSPPVSLRPSIIVNATGAWVDETLERLQIPADRLMGGTKGSHLFSFSPRLKDQLAGQGIYAEARDGRPIFITPLGDTILIGTTDMPFSGSPQTAQASETEIQYLLDSANAILPGAQLSPSDVNFHYTRRASTTVCACPHHRRNHPPSLLCRARASVGASVFDCRWETDDNAFACRTGGGGRSQALRSYANGKLTGAAVSWRRKLPNIGRRRRRSRQQDRNDHRFLHRQRRRGLDAARHAVRIGAGRRDRS